MEEADLVEMVEDVLLMAEEEGAVSSEEALLAFLLEYLPPDSLQALSETLGCNDKDGDEQNVVRVLYEDRYAKEDEQEEEEDGEGGNYASAEPFCCVLCDRIGHMTRHHLYPRETHSLYLKRGLATESELQTTIRVCPTCHKTIHRFFTNKQLAESKNTLDKLLEDERISKYAKWASKQTTGKTFRVR